VLGHNVSWPGAATPPGANSATDTATNLVMS
jgi:hypothetical protein